MDQRLVVRIQLLIPLFALSSYAGLHSEKWSAVLDPMREVYEAFVIYTFFTLLTNLLGGERDIIITTSGRAPVAQIPPVDSCLPPVDISDPYTFLTIKRGVLQYAWLKPILTLITVVLRATGHYHPNTLGWKSGYMWLGIVYNLSITVSLYCLGLFWLCLVDDLKPYRPVPKFMCIKAVIFFSYWQGFALAILVFVGIIPSTGQNLYARTIQNCLMCIEMFGFAILHWFAFSYHDYATFEMIGFARLPVYRALRDSLGVVDLIEDFKATFYGDEYGYRYFDSVEAVMAHPDSATRQARIMAGLRYKNGGRSKYWLPQSSLKKKRELETSQALLFNNSNRTSYGIVPDIDSGEDETVVPYLDENNLQFDDDTDAFEADDAIYTQARRLKYGDYNYPVVTVRDSLEYRPIADRMRDSQ